MDLNSIKLNRNKNDSIKVEEIDNREIAIIGMAVNLPSANSLEEFWNNIKSGKDCIKDFPSNRKEDIESLLKACNRYNENLNYEKAAYLDNIDMFDYSFFNISPNEAILMDPNQKLFLETAWNAIEDAGYGGDKLEGTRTGVYLGFGGDSEYKQIISEIKPDELGNSIVGNTKAIISSRINYLKNMKGPTMNVDTTCSSSLVALHLACNGIRNGDCDMAIVGAVKIKLLPYEWVKIGIESTDSITKSFDEKSDGTGAGEGVLAIVLKSLNKAKEENDNIYAVIKGSAINSDGRSNGITAPNPLMQEEVLLKAWENSGISPETIEYIEAHGTGTKIGDPIEIEGIKRAFSRYTDKKNFCGLGALKTNIGHLDSASGLAGVVKAVLTLKNRELPTNINFKSPNRKIDFINSPLYLLNRNKKIGESNSPIRCGVSSFGLSGTNCHIVLEEYITKDMRLVDDNIDKKTELFTLSAVNLSTLYVYVNNMLKFLQSNENIDCSNLAYTLNTGRGHYNFRVAIIFNGYNDLMNKLMMLVKMKDNLLNEKDIFISRNIGDINQVKFESKEIEKIISSYRELNNYNQDKALKDIASFYVNLGQVNWDDLYIGRNLKRISAPTYPFEKKRTWIEVKSDSKLEINTSLEGKGNEGYSLIEKEIANIWGKVLGYKNLNIYDNFFEIGGDSISISKLFKLIEDKYNDTITVADIFNNPTIFDLAKFIDNKLVIKELSSSDIEEINEDRELSIKEMLLRAKSGELSVEDFIDSFNEV